MERWTRAQVEQYAPDAKSVTAALKLARPGPWSETGSTDTLLWGKCQGSGRTAYQVSVDLTGPAVKCTCPSRKFPCKHGVALLLLWVEGDGSIADATDAADFAADWKQDRDGRAERKVARADTPVDAEAQAKRLEKRLALMTNGLADFERWLADMYRQGLAATRAQPFSFWDDAAARLQDAQVPGLAARVREGAALLHTGDDWADRLLHETSRWYTAARAWHRRSPDRA